MKKIVSIVCATLFILSSSIVVVSADEKTDSFQKANIEQARTVAENYVEIGGIDKNISPAGTDLTKLEVREIIPTMFIRQMQNKSYTPEEMAEKSLAYTAVVWSDGRPTALLTMDQIGNTPLSVSIATAGGAAEFIAGLERARANTINGTISAILPYGATNYYFYSETANGYTVMPMNIDPEERAIFSNRYTDDILIPQDDFEAACTEYMDFLDTASPDEIPMGGGGVLEYLPLAKANAVAGRWTPIVVGIIVAGCCCAIFCIVLERSRKKNHLQ